MWGNRLEIDFQLQQRARQSEALKALWSWLRWKLI